MVHSRNSEVLRALSKGAPLSAIGLGEVGGRVDCRGIRLEPIKPTGKSFFGGLFIKATGAVAVSKQQIERVDFTGSRLDHLSLAECFFRDCVFDESSCKHWRLWGCTFADCSFRNVDLRYSGLGGVDGIGGSKRNTYRGVWFKASDLRSTAYISATFSDCVFDHCKLNKVDFQGTEFEHCAFMGELREVMFYRYGFRGDRFPPNSMRGVSFSDAQLRMCDFRRLDLSDVVFPADSDHVVVHDCRTQIPVVLAELASLSGAECISALLRNQLDWLGENQQVAVFNVLDFEECAGSAVASAAAEVLRQAALRARVC